MARFYFHATDGRELVRDVQGDEIVRPEELLSRAQLVARRVMATQRSRPDWRAWTVVGRGGSHTSRNGAQGTDMAPVTLGRSVRLVSLHQGRPGSLDGTECGGGRLPW